MTDIRIKEHSISFSGLPCYIQLDQEPVTEKKPQHGTGQLDIETLGWANDQNTNPSQSSTELHYENTQSLSKQQHSVQSTKSTRSNGETFMFQKVGKHSSKDPSPIISCNTVFEKWAGLQDEEQRPSTKRQLSAESASRCVSLSKKGILISNKKEVVKPHSLASPGEQPRKDCLPIRSSSRRRPRKQLFSSTGVFLKVDSHAISTGRKVKHTHTQTEKYTFSIKKLRISFYYTYSAWIHFHFNNVIVFQCTQVIKSVRHYNSNLWCLIITLFALKETSAGPQNILLWLHSAF